MKTELYNVTNLEPIALAATLFLSLWFLFASRRTAMIPVVLLACFLPVAQRLVVGGIDLSMLRILLVVGWLRILMRGEFGWWKLNALDRVFLAWIAVSGPLIFVNNPALSTAVWWAGRILDFVSIYALARCLIRDASEMERFFEITLMCTIPFAGLMAVEHATGRNFLSMFGGVPEITHVRSGRMRCQGPFPHAIMAGTFGASLAPIALSLIVGSPRKRVFGVVTFISSTLIVAYSASSGPALGWVAGLGAFSLWPLRQYLRPMRWGLLATLILLHIVMKGPVWHLIGRLNVIGGSTGYHRYRLIDAAIDQFPNWWLLGTRNTAGWGDLLWDTTNHYILAAVWGGIWGLGLFIAMLSLAFRNIGRTVKRLERGPISSVSSAERRAHTFLFWGFGASLFCHTVSFAGVSYFGQIEVFLFSLFAITATCEGWSMSLLTKKGQAARQPSRARALLRPTGPNTPAQPTF